MSELKAVLFDLDDTLIDHSYSVEQALISVRDHCTFMKDLSTRELRKLWHVNFWKYWPEVIHEKMSLFQSRYQRLKEMFISMGCDMTDEDVEDLAEIYGRNYLSNIRPISGAAQLLERISGDGFQISVVTNTTIEMLNEKLRITNLEQFVDFSVSAQETGALKPDPLIFTATLEKSGSSPEESVLVGDSFESDILGAKRSGIAPVWFNRFRRPLSVDAFKVPVLESYNAEEHPYETIIYARESLTQQE